MARTEEYYSDYWTRRLKTAGGSPPIRPSIPAALVRYSQYGACLGAVPENSRLLDLGCGEGNVTRLYHDRKGCETYGLELPDIPIEKARERGVNATKWDLNEFPYPFGDSSFDVITVVDVLEHVTDPMQLLREAVRMLKAGGLAVVLVPNFARAGNRLRMLFAGDPMDVLHWGGYGDGMEHLHWFTAPKLREFMRQAGFSRTRFNPVGLPFGFLWGLIGRYNMARLLVAVGEK